jgi:hypothetical protein
MSSAPHDAGIPELDKAKIAERRRLLTETGAAACGCYQAAKSCLAGQTVPAEMNGIAAGTKPSKWLGTPVASIAARHSAAICEDPHQYAPKWSDGIWGEVARSLAGSPKISPQRTSYLSNSVSEHFPGQPDPLESG